MTARFAGKNDPPYALEQGYDSFPTTKGKVFLPSGTRYKKETLTFGLERFLWKSNITMDGLEVISPSR